MSSAPDELLAIILSNTYTVQDIERRLSILRSCVEAALFTETDLSYLEECALFLSDKAPAHDAEAIKEWGEPVLTAFSQSNLQARMKALESAVETLPVLTLYIPCTFPEDELKMLGDWCRAEYHPETLLDLHVDASVVGGCGLVSKDTYYDLSFSARKQEFPELITNLLAEYARK